MIYRNIDIPSNFNKVAEISDNYIVWVREITLRSDTKYEAYIQYYCPSFYYYYTDDYKIKNGDNYIYNANYVNNGVYSYIDNYDVEYTLATQEIDDEYISSNDTARYDYITIFIGQLLCVVCILWVFKQLSRLFFKGGLS